MGLVGRDSQLGKLAPGSAGGDVGADVGADGLSYRRRLRGAGVVVAVALLMLAVWVVAAGPHGHSSWDRFCVVARADAPQLRAGGDGSVSALRELAAVSPEVLEPSFRALTVGDASRVVVGDAGVDVGSAVRAGAAHQRRLAASESVSSLLASHCAIKGVR